MNTVATVINAILLAGSIGVIVLLVVRSGINAKKRDDIKRRFLDAEDAANSVRKKEIDAELFYKAELEKLPKIPEDDPHQVQRCAARTMIRFATPMTNLELKKTYGPQQIESIAQYEENFSEYLKALTKWAVSIAQENQEDTLTILETVISLGGEFRDAYKLTADIYAATGRNLSDLEACAAANHFKDPAIRRQVLDYIYDKGQRDK